MNKASLLSVLPLLAGVVSIVGCGQSDPLKNDAYVYYGLGNTAPMRLQITYGESGGIPAPATRTVVPGKKEGDKQTFVLKHEGELAHEGDITLSLEPTGIYAISSTKDKIVPHSIELPAKLDIGTTWKDHTQMAEQKIDLQNELKVVGKERVATPGGTFDEALHVTSTGSGTYGGDPATLTTESWYVRDVGPVKQIVVVTRKKSAKQVVTIELAPPEKAPDASGADLGGGGMPGGDSMPGGMAPGGAPGGMMPGGTAPGGMAPGGMAPGGPGGGEPAPSGQPAPPKSGGKK